MAAYDPHDDPYDGDDDDEEPSNPFWGPGRSFEAGPGLDGTQVITLTRLDDPPPLQLRLHPDPPEAA